MRLAYKAYVEYVIKEYNKPLGVIKYQTKEIPKNLQNSLTDIEDLRRLQTQDKNRQKCPTLRKEYHLPHFSKSVGEGFQVLFINAKCKTC